MPGTAFLKLRLLYRALKSSTPLQPPLHRINSSCFLPSLELLLWEDLDDSKDQLSGSCGSAAAAAASNIPTPGGHLPTELTGSCADLCGSELLGLRFEKTLFFADLFEAAAA